MAPLPTTSKERHEADRERNADRVLEDQTFQRLRTRGARLTLVVVGALLCIGIVPAFVAGGWTFGVSLSAATWLNWWLLRVSVRTVADLPDRFLDERQRAIRDRSYMDAYRIFSFTIGGLVTLGLVAFSFLQENDSLILTLSWDHAFGVTMFILVLGSILPSMAVAVRDPAEPTTQP